MHSIINAEISHCRVAKCVNQFKVAGFFPKPIFDTNRPEKTILICSDKVRRLAKQKYFQVHWKIYPLKHDLLLWAVRLSSAIKMGVSITLSACSVLKATLRLNNSKKTVNKQWWIFTSVAEGREKSINRRKARKIFFFGLNRLQRDAMTGKVIWKKVSNYCPAQPKSITRENCFWRRKFGRSEVMRRENCLNHKWTLAVNHCTSNTSFK